MPAPTVIEHVAEATAVTTAIRLNGRRSAGAVNVKLAPTFSPAAIDNLAAISDATCLDTLARLLRDHGSDGPVSDESLTALARVLGEQQAAMPAEGKAVDAATWPVQQLRNARYAATLSPDLAAEFEPTAARILAALASAANRPDNGGERTAP